MAALLITCVISDGSDDDSRIDSIGGGISFLQSEWRHSIDIAILNIKLGIHTYYTMNNGLRAKVVIRRHYISNREYLTTEPDGYSGNNLSKLQTCPLNVAC